MGNFRWRPSLIVLKRAKDGPRIQWIEKEADCRLPKGFQTNKRKVMTTSCLYHTQGIRGFKYQKSERRADTEIYYLHSTASHLACPCCGCKDTCIVKTGKTRDIRGLCIGLKKRSCVWPLAVFFAANAGLPRRSPSPSVPAPTYITPNGWHVLFWLCVRPCRSAMWHALAACTGKA